MSNTLAGDQKFKTFVFIFMDLDNFLTFRRKRRRENAQLVMKWVEKLALALLVAFWRTYRHGQNLSDCVGFQGIFIRHRVRYS